MIQKVLVATRPYGATPIAAMLDDARTYFVSDTSNDPLDSSFRFGPQNDPAALCRGKSIILLSDGQPNMDLRPYCEPAGCPYSKPEDIAQDLKSRGIEIYVIGFALGKPVVNGVPKPCSDIDPNDASPTADCKLYASDPAMQACCSLNRIAAAGGHVPLTGEDSNWTRAHFADDRAGLRKALSDAIGGNLQTTSRTPWVNASGAGFVNQSSDWEFARSFRLNAPFKPGKLDKPWTGQLNRSRYICTSEGGGPQTPKLVDLDPAKGDMFVTNVNKAGPSKRKIFTVLGNGGVAPVKSDVSMRPNLPVGVVDGVGNYSGTMNTTEYSSDTFVKAVVPDAIKVNDTSCDSSTENLDALQCRDRILKWVVGLDNGTAFQRCQTPASCNLVAEIYHSIPRAVPGRPAQFLNDATYQKFIQDQVKRPSMVYASTNDGFLHAFKLGPISKDDTNVPVTSDTPSNELWTFVPPGVLPGLPTFYPGTHQLLLDGTPAIKEVVATKDETQPVYKYRLMRTLAQAQNATNVWRTILVQSYGAQRPGYFALDITDPMLDAGGPKFLWQVTTDNAGNQLFGIGGATPLITTVYLDGAEVAVAVLPGGYGSPGTDNPSGNSKGCARGKDYSTGWPDGVPAPRSNVKCYSGSAVMARSLTVVRLDSGEILRTFRQKATEVPGLSSTVVKESPIDSPMTGTPVAFPPDVAGVADRVFIGDQDGALWRLNLASEKGKIDDWSLDLFFDGFPKDTFTQDQAWRRGQPVIAAPVLSVDDLGQITLGFSTGDQEAIGAEAGMKNFVWSLSEVPSADRKQLNPKVNWSLDLKDAWSGDRVIGDLVLFNSNLYFTTLGPDATGDACSSGSGKLWGMHYLTKSKLGDGKGGALADTFSGGKMPVTPDGYVPASIIIGGGNINAYLSGVSVAQQPSCESPGVINDPGYSGYGVTTGAATASGKFQLIFGTGNAKSVTKQAGFTPIQSGGANATAIDLPTPSVALIVDSWAAIVE
jgi:type IV pilus assembly protein PilY1